MDSVEKKKLWIFVAVAYGVTAIMSIFMYIGLRREIDITAFVNVQMMYPACGVIIGKLVSRKDGGKRQTIDTAKVKEQFPEVYAQCIKESSFSESLTIKIKEK